MFFLARLAFISMLLLTTFNGASAAEKVFSHQGIAADAKRYEAFLKANWKPEGKPAAILKADAEKSFASDPRAASRSLAAAVAEDDKDWASWTQARRGTPCDQARPEPQQ